MAATVIQQPAHIAIAGDFAPDSGLIQQLKFMIAKLAPPRLLRFKVLQLAVVQRRKMPPRR